MKQKKEMSIIYYMYRYFIGIIFVMAIIMIIFISYFSNRLILSDIRKQIRRESKYDFLNIEVKNEQILVNKNFVFKDNHVEKVVLNDYGKLLYGNYPDKSLKNYPINNKKAFYRIKTSSGDYYIFDRRIIKRDLYTKNQQLIIIRSIGKESDFTSDYETLKYVSYMFIGILIFISCLLIRIVATRLTIPIAKIQETADKLGTDGDLTQRIEYNTLFTEINAMIRANNRMIDRLESLFQQQQQFTSDVAHELRTPTSIVSAECQYLKKYGKTIEDYTESLTVIERQNKKTTEIITQLLHLSRLDQGRIKDEFEYSNFKTLIESICESEPLRTKKQMIVYYNLDDISIHMNVGLMSIAVKNLINNAMKYSKDNSSIKLRLWEENGYVLFEVKDYGCGMSEETQKHIYDRFYRADKSRNTEGFGLGLALVHKIVELHNGSIIVKSELGEGSIFTLSLPCL